MISQLMEDFANSTGLLETEQEAKRYLWTDALAVCNYFELYNRTSDKKFIELAQKLIEQVHLRLGKYRTDDNRSGWISSLSESEGVAHPTAGGLRIGKDLPERSTCEPFDEDLEWERDGQYFHYLTRWIHALCTASCITGNSKYNTWATELAHTAYNKFVYFSEHYKCNLIYWKMSTDLSYPLILTPGQHDPLDGYITYYSLKIHAKNTEVPNKLLENIDEFYSILLNIGHLTTDDPLGLGSMLTDAYRATNLKLAGKPIPDSLLVGILEATADGLKSFADDFEDNLPASNRLAFRELGLSIGLKALKKLSLLTEKEHSLSQLIGDKVKFLSQFKSIAKDIDDFWMEPKNRANNLWEEHRDINTVILVTSLAPDIFLG